jgi:potassium efflux system protein
MRPRVGLALASFALFAALSAPAVRAQDTEPAATPTTKGPGAIALADIPVRAFADEGFAQDVILRSKGRDPAEKLTPRLDRLDRAVREQTALFQQDDLRYLPVIRLESLERHWRFYRKQFESWRDELKDATTPYSDDASQLAKRRSAWEATRATAVDGGMAPALAHRVDSVLAEIAVAEQAVSEPLEKQIELSRRANLVGENIDAGQKAVAAAIAYNDSRLRRIDSPPLWRLDLQSRDSGSALESLKTGFAIETRFLNEYNAANARTRQLYTWFEVLLLPFLIWLSFRSRKIVSDDPEIQASVRVLRRPLSSWLLLVIIGLLVIEPDAPIILHQFVLLAALVPVLRLLPPKVYRVLGPWPYAATLLYLLNLLSFLWLPNPLIYRSYLLLVTLLTLGTILWLLSRSRARTDGVQPTGAARIVRIVAWIGIGVLFTSAVSNVVGNVTLAHMLTRALLNSGYVGLALFAGVTVLASLMRLAMARRSVSRFHIVTRHAGPLLQRLSKVLHVAALLVWIVIVMNAFRVFRPVYEATRNVLTYPLQFGEISLTLWKVTLFFFSIYLAFWVARTVRLVLHEEVLPKMSLPRGVANSVSSLSYYALLMVGLMMALAAAGFEMDQLALVVGALGVGIGFGLQNVVNNFVSGLILMFERPIQPGDVVEITGTAGKVREIGMRATTLTTFEGADVVVPNGTLLSEKLINWTLRDMNRRLDVNVGVAYGTDPKKVLELLMDVTKSTPGVAEEPQPTVLFAGFGASSLDFSVRAWTNDFADWVRVRSNLTVRIHDAIVEAGIEIPFPQHDLHLRSVSPDAGAVFAPRTKAETAMEGDEGDATAGITSASDSGSRAEGREPENDDGASVPA